MHPDKIAYSFINTEGILSEEITYKSLLSFCISFAKHIDNNAGDSDAAILLFPAGLDYIKSFFATGISGKTVIPLPLPANPDSTNFIALIKTISGQNSKKVAIITNKVIKESLDKLFSDFNIIAIEHTLLEETVFFKEPNENACFLFTSGSTSTPKGVIITQDNLIHNGASVTSRYGYSENSITVSWLPHFHAFGMLVNIIYPLFSGSGSILFTPSDFAADPLRWIQHLSYFKATHTGSPNFGFDCAAIEAEKNNTSCDLTALSVAFCAGEPIKQNTYHRFYNKFKSHNLRVDFFKPMYGMSEACTVAAKDSGTPVFMQIDLQALNQNKISKSSEIGTSKTISGCGTPLPGVDILIIKDDHQQAASDEIGEIWISGPSLFKNYTNTSHNDSGFAERNGKRYFKTGDLGFIKDEELFIAGRTKEVIIINGKNHYPADIETSVAISDTLLADVRKIVFSIIDNHSDEKIIAIAEEPPEVNEINILCKKVAASVLEYNGIRLGELIFVKRGSLPTTASGKLQRNACKNLFQSNSLAITFHKDYYAEIHSKNDAYEENTITIQIREFFSDFNKSSFKGNPENISIFELGSIELIRLSRKIKNHYDINIEVSEIVTSENIRKLGDLVLKKISEPKTTTENSYNKESGVHVKSGLSINQRGLLIDYSRNHHTFRYNTPLAFQLSDKINITLLAKVLDEIQDNHPVLRGRIIEIDNQPVFTISEKKVSLRISNVPGDRNEITQHILSKAWIPFKPSETESLFHTEIIQGSNDKKYLYLNASHLLLDGMSCQILLKEIVRLYNQKDINITEEWGKVTDLQFLNFADWESKNLLQTNSESLKEYWTSKNNLFQGLNLPYDAQSSNSSSPGILCFSLPEDLLVAADTIAQKNKISRYALFLSAYFVLLYKYTRQESLTIGTAFLNRPEEQFETALGFFSNVQPVYSDVKPDTPFQNFASSIYAEINKLISFQSYPYPELVKFLRETGISCDSLLFQTFFLYQDWLTDLEENTVFQNQIFEVNQAAVGDLTFELLRTIDESKILVKYNADRFNKSTIEFIADNYFDILERISTAPENTIRELLNLSEKEKNLLNTWNSTYKEIPKISNLYTIFEEKANSHPEKVAIITSNSTMTYNELYYQVQILSNSLYDFGIKKGSRVAILLSRTENIPMAFLSLYKIGATYIPLDPELPENRLNYILEHASPDLVLTSGIRPKGYPILDINNGIVQNSYTIQTEFYAPDDTLCLIYTSGSTGKPKGVEVPYHGFLNFYQAIIESPGITDKDIILAISTISFDISFTEIIVPLLTGSSVYIASEEEQKSGEELRRIIESYKITILQGTPTTFKLILKSGWDNTTSLKKAISTGEALPQEIAKGILSTGVELWDLYGPTEATIESTYCQITNSNDISIGRPLANTRLHVLDESFYPVPIGAQGELYIAGDGLAKGYLNQPELTEEKFIRITDQPVHEQVIYKTGDIVRFSTDGMLYYYGRNDHQVKVRGYRIELEEIEHILKNYQNITDCCVSAEKNVSGNIELKACIISDSGQLNIQEIQVHLKKFLPTYMIPSSFYKRAELPLLPNGKIDRNLLFTNGEYLTAKIDKSENTNDIEKQIIQIWEEVLGKAASGMERAFFDEGGSSLLIPELQNKFIQYFPELRIRLVDFFKYTTIRAQANWIEKENLTAVRKVSKPLALTISEKETGAIEIIETQLRKDIRINYR
ncbi:non-ribosomal peptide synthetase module containing protein [Sporocytophaga myxococcoides]|uniref:Non-ribosomal peptide synthetase module containing protein n=2 Tax=Sporocytophaga myxococcoides TaxID=153721 RepID=A0A098L9T5_9BACT|nr:non-ribosomal peptide synthetase module containing protein [Sporocytophaga myxococcoides]